jgi:hypothetical protein
VHVISFRCSLLCILDGHTCAGALCKPALACTGAWCTHCTALGVCLVACMCVKYKPVHTIFFDCFVCPGCTHVCTSTVQACCGLCRHSCRHCAHDVWVCSLCLHVHQIGICAYNITVPTNRNDQKKKVLFGQLCHDQNRATMMSHCHIVHALLQVLSTLGLNHECIHHMLLLF